MFFSEKQYGSCSHKKFLCGKKYKYPPRDKTFECKAEERRALHQLVRKRIENLSDLRYPAETSCKPSVNDIRDTGKYKYSGCRGKSVRIVCKENVCKRKYESYTYRRENIRNIFKFHPCLR